jgi:hypothetical protein
VSGSATTGTWNDGGVGGTFSPSATTLNATYTPPASYTGTVTLTLTAPSSSCGSSTASKTLTVNAPSSATISYTNSSICSTVSAAQNVTLTGTTGGTFSASPSGLTINSSTGAVTASTSTPGNYTVTYSISSASGCSAFSTTTTIEILQAPINNAYKGASAEFYDFAPLVCNNSLKSFMPLVTFGAGVRFKHLEAGLNNQVSLASPVNSFAYNGFKHSVPLSWKSIGYYVGYRIEF